MAKNHIYVGNEYKQAFDSICELIRGGCFSGLNWSVRGDVIDDGVYEYELSAAASGRTESVKHGFTKDGATWFKSLRGEAVENNNAVWTAFIEAAGIEFHKRFSVVEYQQQKRSKEEKAAAKEAAVRIIDGFTRAFYPAFNGRTELREVMGEDVIEDIYGVSMRIELSGGTGASLPVLGKVYFNKTGRNLIPIRSFAAEQIDANLNQIIPEDSEEATVVSAESVIDTTLNAIDNLISENNVNFADYLCFSDNSDKVAVENLMAQLSHDAVELECPRVDILYISRIKASAFVYDVYSAGSPLFRLTLGINNTVSISCINCAYGENMVDRNQITYKVGDEVKSVTIDPEAEDFGLTAEEIEQILSESDFSNHFMKITCPIATRGQSCEMLKCRTQVFDSDSGPAIVYKCIDCPYPEMVYTTKTGEKKWTPLLVFAKDKMELVDPGEENGTEVAKCADCGRYFSIGVLKHKKCPVCHSATLVEGDAEARKKYKEYKGLLSLGVRLKALFAKKYCVEDDEIIIFLVGKKKYIFNKLNVTEKGYVNKPIRIE